MARLRDWEKVMLMREEEVDDGFIGCCTIPLEGAR